MLEHPIKVIIDRRTAELKLRVDVVAEERDEAKRKLEVIEGRESEIARRGSEVETLK